MTTSAAETKQLSLKDDGQIYWQQDPTNPMPGVPVARVLKGEAALAPKVEMLPELGLTGEALAAALVPIEEWLAAHIHRVLEPLVKLAMVIEGTPEPVQQICNQVYAGLGIVPRDDVRDLIAALDTEMRKTLRGRHVRLGPVLVFVPDLNKPAAVRLRALLWSLYHDKPLPAPSPRDGAVSQVVEVETADPAFYQAIGYPLYANRVIRIDMLDRVMNAVYEGVKDNQFQAKHQMAEWLGCSVPDLYLVLEAMGHKKIHDPADTAVVVDAAAVAALAAVVPVDDAVVAVEPAAVVEAPAEPTVGDEAIATAQPTAEDQAAPAATATTPAAARPELATFKVWWPRKAGAAKEHAPEGHKRPRRAKQPSGPKTPPAFEYLDPAEIAAKESARVKRSEGEAGEGGGRRGGKGRDDRARDDDRGVGDKKFVGRQTGGRNVGGRGGGMSFGGGTKQKSKPVKLDKGLRLAANTPTRASQAVDDSPFAILNTLKFKKD